MFAFGPAIAVSNQRSSYVNIFSERFDTRPGCFETIFKSGKMEVRPPFKGHRRLRS